MLGASSSHPHQLTLAEFASIKLQAVLENLDFMSLARGVRAQPDASRQDAQMEHEENTDDEDQGSKAMGRSFEDVGGTNDDEGLEGEPYGIPGSDTPLSQARFALDFAIKLLCGIDEVARASAPSRKP